MTTLVVRKGVPRCAARPHAIEIARGNVQTAKIRRKAAQERLALHLKSPRPVAVASPTVATTDHNGMFVLSYIFGGLFVVMFLLAKLRQKLARRERLAAIPASAVE